MFKNRSLVVKVAKDQENSPEFDPLEGVRIAAAYADIAKDVVTHTALVIGGVWAACKIIERLCR